MLQGKKGLIMGIANNRSIAWGITEVLNQNGAEIAFTYAGEAFKKRVVPLVEPLGAKIVLPCDVTNEDEIDALVQAIKQEYGQIDFFVHSLAFSDRNELQGRYVNTSRDNFLTTLDVSCYSFTLLAQKLAPIMNKGGSMMSMTYYGSQKVLPNYNVMGVAKAALESSIRYLAYDLGQDGIRVNGISAGTVRTLAASGISGFRTAEAKCAEASPLKRNVTVQEIGKTALYLLSDLSSGVTGEIVYVDAGSNIMALS